MIETGARDATAVETRLLAFELEGTAESTGRTTLDRAAVLYFHPEARVTWDVLDATKLTPPAAAYAVLAFVGERDGQTVLQAQESRAFDLTEAIELPLQVAARGTTGPLTLSWPVLANVPDAWVFTLRDNVTGERVDLREATEYTFDATSVSAPPQGPADLLERGQVGTVERSGGARFTLVVAPRSTADEPGGTVPTALALTGIYPNPSAGSTLITFDVPAGAGDVTVEVYDMLGRRVASVVTGPQQPGRHAAPWNAGALPSGTYLVRLRAADGSGVAFDQTRTLTIAR